MCKMNTKTIPPLSIKKFIHQRKISIIAYISIYIVTLFLFIFFSNDRWWLPVILFHGGSLGGTVIGIYFKRRWHPVKISFDEDNSIFLIKENSGEVRKVSPRCIGRHKNNTEIKVWNYVYIFEKKGKEKFRGVPIPYEADEWIQEIKREHQQKLDHEYIKKNTPNSKDSIFDKFSP
ncbi:MAG: hypothetical protein ACOC8Y_02625 [Candidatus Natronoplasma sp.]